MGFFIRKDFLSSLNDPEEEEDVTEPIEELIECENYKLINLVDYPFFHDSRNRDEKIFDEFSYHVNRFRWMEELYFNYEADRFEIPIDAVTNACWQVTDDIREIRSVIEGKFVLENEFIILPPNESQPSEHDEDTEEEIAPNIVIRPADFQGWI